MRRLTVQQKLAILIAAVIVVYWLSSPFLTAPPEREQSIENLAVQAEAARRAQGGE